MSTSNDIDKKIDFIKSEADVFEKVKILHELIRSGDLRVKEIAERLNKKSSYICHLHRLRKLPDIIIDGYFAKQVSLSHLFILSRLPDKEKMMYAYERVLAESLTIKRTEELVREILYGIKTTGDYITNREKEEFLSSLKSVNRRISAELIQSRIKSKLVIELKGDLEDTTKWMKNLMETVKRWQLG